MLQGLQCYDASLETNNNKKPSASKKFSATPEFQPSTRTALAPPLLLRLVDLRLCVNSLLHSDFEEDS